MSSSQKRKRQKKITVRLTEQEFADLADKANSLQITAAEYIRRSVQKEMPQPIFPKDEAVEIILQLKKLGNNINQLTHLVYIEKVQIANLEPARRELQKLYLKITCSL